MGTFFPGGEPPEAENSQRRCPSPGDGGPDTGVQLEWERTGPLNTAQSKDYYFYSFFK